MKLSKRLFRLLVLMVLAQFILLGFGLLFYNTSFKKSQIDEFRSSLTDLDSNLLESIVFHHKQNDLGTRDLLVYEAIELKLLDGAEIKDTSYLKSAEFKNNYQDCQRKESSLTCINTKTKRYEAFLPLVFDNENIGYLGLVKAAPKFKSSSETILWGSILLLMIIINLGLFYYFQKKYFKDDFLKLFSAVQVGKTDGKIDFAVKENEDIYMAFKKALMSLKDSEQEKASLAAKAEIYDTVARIAHDIRNPSRVLRTRIEKINEGQEISKAERDFFIKASNRIESLANDYLDQYKQNNRVQKFDAIQALKEIIDEKQELAEGKITLKSQIDSYILEWNPQEFSRIYDGLIQNAIESYQGDMKDIDIVVDLNGDMLNLKIQDFGKGIPEKDMNTIFDKGLSIDKENGTGLGLYYAKEKVEKFGGSIFLYSKLNVGTLVETII